MAYSSTLKVEEVGPPKIRWTFIGFRGITFPRTVISLVTAVRTSNPITSYVFVKLKLLELLSRSCGQWNWGSPGREKVC
jgi:hypothetical protein